MSEPATVYIAFGGNVGDREGNLRAALALLQQHVQIEAVSSLYETEPAYVLDQPRFLNGVLRGSTALVPLDLLHALKQIEAAVGRLPGPRNGPRPVDLDILHYGDLALDTPELTIPHPRMAERPFVLVPLAEIAPELVRMDTTRAQGEVVRRIAWDYGP
ncbi:MAG: 2-amino-4-hydroxy-6-hydroxymethyldihydropteridine diphosphokinase [Chloroflexales bacterium]|nr:2-amino-4-hydroxy-6-hydroxymethyldihydropteridine diphosphokinase [Chloroflexales bacterium]